MPRKSRKTGAPPPSNDNGKLTPEIQETICEAIRAGNYRKVAARLVGIDRATLYNWTRWGEQDPDSIYGAFENALRLAEAEAEAGTLAIIMRAAAEQGQWQAAAWMAERKWPQRWRMKSAHDDAKAQIFEAQREKLALENEKLRLENEQLRSGGSDATITIVIPPVPDESE